MFEKIIGNEKNKQILSKTIEVNKISHSYIFCGTEGIGKKIIAKELSKAILCLDNQKCCGKCKSCIEFDTSNNPDFFLIEPNEGKIKIDQIREMQRRVAEKPIISEKKVFIIDNSETMTIEAQNCLLKTLEEPPQYLTIILICSNENNLLSTIKSRCTRMYFEPLSEKEIITYLGKEKINKDIVELSQGSISKLLKLKDNEGMYENLKEILTEMKSQDLIEIVQKSEEIYKSKEEIYSILEYMNVLLLKLSKIDIRYINCIEIIEETKKRLKANSNYDMCIDNMIFKVWEEMNEKNSRSKI